MCLTLASEGLDSTSIGLRHAYKELGTTNRTLKHYTMEAAKNCTNDTNQTFRHFRNITAITFNLNQYSEQQCLIDFCFKRAVIPNISALCGWQGRNRYNCDALTTICVILCRHAYQRRWRYLENTYGMHDSKLSEVFWETVDSLYTKNGHLSLNFVRILLTSNRTYTQRLFGAR